MGRRLERALAFLLLLPLAFAAPGVSSANSGEPTTAVRVVKLSAGSGPQRPTGPGAALGTTGFFTSPSAAGAAAARGGVPGSCCDTTITQNLDGTTVNVGASTVACSQAAGAITVENAWARCFPGSTFPTDFTLKCVDFGVEENNGCLGDFDVDLRVVRLVPTVAFPTLACPLPAGLVFGDSILGQTWFDVPPEFQVLHLQTVTIPDGFAGVMQVTLSSLVVIPAGSEIVVEIHAASRAVGDGGDDGAFRVGSNEANPPGAPATYIWAAQCGLNNYIDVASINATFTADFVLRLDGSSGPSADCNTIPDSCEPDCNANGVSDACDIAGGTSLDCDANGLPDECGPADAEALPGDLLVVSRQFGTIYALDPATGAIRSLISGSELRTTCGLVRGTGDSLANAFRNSLFAFPDGRIFVRFSSALDIPGLYSVDTLTGDRTLLPGTNGPTWRSSGSVLALDTNTLLSTADHFGLAGEGSVVSYDLSTNITTIITSPTVGDGPTMNVPRGMALLNANTLAVVETGFLNDEVGVFLVNMTTGDRTFLSRLSPAPFVRNLVVGGIPAGTVILGDDEGGSGPVANRQSRSVAFVNGRLIVGQTTRRPDLVFSGGFFEIDPVTGDRTLLVGEAFVDNGLADTLVGAPPSNPLGIIISSPIGLQGIGNDDVIFTSIFEQLIYRFNLSTSALDVISDVPAQIDPSFAGALRPSGLAVFAGTDCNNNGLADATDLTVGNSQDCNGNGIPDECDIGCTSQDCNGNGIPDECDISEGTSQDIIGAGGFPDGIPDECQLDCNGNLIPDVIDIAGGTSQDCNGNGIPDECETDCNANGIPDDCDLAAGQLFGADLLLGELIAIDPATGAGSTVGPLGIVGVAGLAFDPVTGTMFGVDLFTPGGQLITIDPATGASTVVGPLGFPDVEGLAYDPNSGTLFGADIATAQLIIIDPATGAGTAVGPPGLLPNVQGLAFDPNTGTLFGADGIQLITIDPATGVGTTVGPMGSPAAGLAFDPATGTLFGTDGFLLISIDPATGASTIVGPIGFPFILGLTFGPGASIDCNANGIPDDCDIAAGTSQDIIGSGGLPDGIPDECQSDCNGNLIPDVTDIAGGTSQDCNSNGIPDECDISGGGSLDCNGNGIPDECEADCNANGIPDDCDIVSGTSPDCNFNGTPDECDITSGFSQDCNLNGIPDECDPPGSDCNANGTPDECDIISGFSQDCNFNGIPDECDIASGFSPDCNGNGIPDECELASNDCNANGIPDDCEFAGNDCNANGIPDECELTGNDCNANGIPDECDLAGNDCNANSIPDECDPDCNNNLIADECEVPPIGAGPDCNGNLIPDACEVPPLGAGADCNANGIPDECELAGNDCNVNGIPDECEPDCNVNGVADECEVPPIGAGPDCNGNLIPDECEDDCNANGIPDDCDIAGCPAGDPSCGDCNNNGIPDGCDIASMVAIDVISNTTGLPGADGVPDDCSKFNPGAGGGTPLRAAGDWSNFNNWLPPEVPNNLPGRVFDASILQSTDVANLDIDATIETLTMGPGATLNMTFDSLSADGDLTITSANGILNSGNVFIGAGRSLIAGTGFLIHGGGLVQLTDPTATLSSLTSTEIITSTSSITGQGVIDAAFVNDVGGLVSAGNAGATLTIQGPNAKTNDGLLEATAGGTLEVSDVAVAGAGVYRADGGTIRLLPSGAITSITGATMEVTNAGAVEVNGATAIDLGGGTMTIDNGGVYLGTAGASAALSADSLAINGAVNGGQMLLSGQMRSNIVAAISIDGSPFPCGPLRGCTPPILSVGGGASAQAASMDVLAGVVELSSGGMLDVAGPVVVDQGGVIRNTGQTTGTMTADSLLMSGSGTGGSQVNVGGSMNLVIATEITVSGCGVPLLGCTPPILRVTNTGNVQAAALDVLGGMVELSGSGMLDVAGPVTVDAGGSIQSMGQTSATMTAQSVSILSGGIGGSGRLDVGGSIDLMVSADLSVRGCGAPPVLGCTPPILRIADSATIGIGGTFSMTGSVQSQVQSSGAVRLAGNFDNRSTAPLLFDWADGSLTLGGDIQTFELAGKDLGPTPLGLLDNFAMGSLTVLSGARVLFSDGFDNSPGAGCEALYVKTLRLEAGSIVRLESCNVYYQELIDGGAEIQRILGGDLIAFGSADLNGDGLIDGNDFDIFLNEFGNCVEGSPPGSTDADLDGDGCVTFVDFQIWLVLFRDANGLPPTAMPIPGNVGDMNGDGMVRGDDIQGFVDVLTNPGSVGFREGFVADFNGDGQYDTIDLVAFVGAVLGEGQ